MSAVIVALIGAGGSAVGAVLFAYCQELIRFQEI